MKTLLILAMLILVGCANAQDSRGYYGPHIKGKVSAKEWAAILRKYHTSFHPHGEREEGAFAAADAEAAILRQLPSRP